MEAGRVSAAAATTTTTTTTTTTGDRRLMDDERLAAEEEVVAAAEASERAMKSRAPPSKVEQREQDGEQKQKQEEEREREEEGGVGRPPDEEEEEEERASTTTGREDSMTSDGSSSSSSGGKESAGFAGQTKRPQAEKDGGFTISWRNLHFVVESTAWFNLAGGPRKPILSGLSGSFKSGELSAVLGPSGAGKSTLIDCLLGKHERGLSGQTRVSFQQAEREQERRKRRPLKIALIPQRDHLLDSLTVTETFMFASRIKNAHLTYQEEEEGEGAWSGSGSSKSKIKGKNENNNRVKFNHLANVQRILQQLNLSSCAKLPCGKLSGGQYKRVSIGQELLARPDLLILDEPTSGLDSVTCHQTIQALRALIERSPYPMAIVATIHQPDIQVFELFHKAYVLAEGGRAIFEGGGGQIFDSIQRGLELVRWRRQRRRLAAASAGSLAEEAASSKDKDKDKDKGAVALAFEEAPDQRLDDLAGQLAQRSANPARLIVEVAASEFGYEITSALNDIHRQGYRNEQEFEEEEEVGNLSAGRQVARAPPEPSKASTLSLAPDGGGSGNGCGGSSLILPSLPSPPSYDYEASSPKRRRAQLDGLLNLVSANVNRRRSFRVYLRHLIYHTGRSWTTIVRDPMLFSVQLGLHVLVPLLISYAFAFHGSGNDACPRLGALDLLEEAYRADKDSILDQVRQELRIAFENLGYMFFQLYVIIFAAVCATSLTYPLAMHVILKEYRNGWYSMSSYFLGRTLADLPIPSLNVVIAMAISYHLTGQPASPYAWRFASVAALTVLASLVAQTQGLMFGAMLMNLPQSAVFVAPASTAPLVVVSGFLLRIKSLPVALQALSKLSYFTYLLNGFIIARYGFNRCPCDESQFDSGDDDDDNQATAHQIPPQARTLINLWVESFASELANATSQAHGNSSDTSLAFPKSGNDTALLVSNLTSTIYNNNNNNNSSSSSLAMELASPLQPQQPQQVDVLGKLVATISRAKAYGFEMSQCSQVKPFTMLDYELEDSDLYLCFAALALMLVLYRWLTYAVLCWKISSSI